MKKINNPQEELKSAGDETPTGEIASDLTSLTSDDIFELLKEPISRIGRGNGEAITLDSLLENDLGVEPVSLLMFWRKVKKAWELEMSNPNAATCTMRDLVQLIEMGLRVKALGPWPDDPVERLLERVNREALLADADSEPVPERSEPRTPEHTSRLASFCSFGGFTGGDTLAKVYEVLGKPQRQPRGSSVVLEYFPEEETIELDDLPEEIKTALASATRHGLTLHFDQTTGRLFNLSVALEEAIYGLRARGIFDFNLSYLGQHQNVILNTFGDPDSSDLHCLSYHVYGPQLQRVCDVTFMCFPQSDYICGEIAVDWSWSLTSDAR